ncbi:MAG: hypothetical protein ABR924_18515 [Terracidiphilus sp.]
MTSNEIKQVVQSIERSFQKAVRVTREDEEGKVYKITLPFIDRKGNPFYIWSFRYPRSRKIQLSDGRHSTQEIGTEGTLQLAAIKSLVNSYGLSLMEDLSIMEISNRPLTQRVTSFLQTLVAVDGSLRMWELMKGKKAK